MGESPTATAAAWTLLRSKKDLVSSYVNSTQKQIQRDLEERLKVCNGEVHRQDIVERLQWHQTVDTYLRSFLASCEATTLAAPSQSQQVTHKFLRDLRKMIHHIEASQPVGGHVSCPSPVSRSKQQPPSKSKQSETKPLPKLPYMLEELTWNRWHTRNEQQKYSYEGVYKPLPAIQCGCCEQWFYLEDLAAGVLPDGFLEFQCKICNPEHVETCNFCKPTWFIAIQSAMANMMWHTQRNNFKVKEIQSFLLQHWDSVCWGFPEEQKKKDPAPYFARKRNFFIQTSPYWELKDLREAPDGTGPPVQPCPLRRGASWVDPPQKNKRKRVDPEPQIQTKAAVSTTQLDMPTELKVLLADSTPHLEDAYGYVPPVFYQPHYDIDHGLDSLSDIDDVDVEELQEQIGSIFQGTDELLFDPNLNGTVLVGQLSRQNSSRGLKRQASACEPDDDVEDGAALLRTSSSRQRANRAWAILRRQVSSDVAMSL